MKKLVSHQNHRANPNPVMVKKYKKRILIIGLLLSNVVLAMNPYDTYDATEPVSHGFMTSRDLLGDATSNITIQNSTGNSITLTGAYLTGVFTSNSCGVAVTGVTNPSNTAKWIVWTPVTLPAFGTLIMGKNYLYNILWQPATSGVATVNSPATAATNGFFYSLHFTTTTGAVYSGAVTDRNVSSACLGFSASTCSNTTLTCTGPTSTVISVA